MFGKPGQSAVQAGFNSYMIASSGRIRIREQKDIFIKYIIFSFHMDQTGHTYRFLQGFPGGRMFCPCLAQIFCYCHSTASSTVIPHIQHQHSGLCFYYLRFGCIGTCHVVHLPCFSAVFTIHDAGIRYTGRVDKLSREY